VADVLLEMKRITKSFSGVKALNDVSFKVTSGEIRALVGENGAGKSTLMNILSGVYPDSSYDGEIFWNNQKCTFKEIKDSEKLGIVIIHQELALIPQLSIAENIFLGNEQSQKGIIDWNRTSKHAKELLQKVGLHEKPSTLTGSLGVGKQQLVEIAKALSKKVRLLILDEPTAALNDEESHKLLQLLIDLKQHGITCILISHKLNEVSEVADAITILRDGKVIETIEKGKEAFHEDQIIKSMVGRELTNRYPDRIPNIGEEIFRVEDLVTYHPEQSERQVVKGVSFYLRKGEVIGFAGLMGAGRTELAMSIFGRSYGQKHSGTVYLHGKEIDVHEVTQAIENGIAYVTEDRKSLGLVLIDDIRKNITLPNLKKVSTTSVINQNEEVLVSQDYRNRLGIRSSGIDQVVESLSGGNQQKVVLAKWLMSNPEVLILDEPTRGIDVGAKFEIYSIINDLVSQGKSLIMISSEMEELLGMCDRIYVVNGGQIAGELSKEEASQESIMKLIMAHQKKTKERIMA
jgi:putative multiple sugar transport system ATP-binding protein